MKFIYFGYFENGRSEYVLTTDEPIDPDKFKWKMRGDATSISFKKRPTLGNLQQEGYYVRNLKTENTWAIKRAEKDFIILDQEELQYEEEADNFVDALNTRGYIMEIAEIHKNSYHSKNEVSNPTDKVFVTGRALPKIKATKEFNYVGQIDYREVPIRNNGDVGK